MKTWTSGETKILCAIYANSTKEELCSSLPNKSYIGIYKKAIKLGLKKSETIKFQNRVNGRKKIQRKNITYSRDGYKMVYMPNHPRANSNGRIFEHIAVFEDANGIRVPEGNVVHHINGNKTDNRPENLLMMERGEHTRLHSTGREMDEAVKSKISVAAKQRLKNHKNHPAYKDIDINALKKEIENGRKVENVCKEYGINKTTYYRKIKEV